MVQNLPLPAAQEVRDSSSVTPCIVMKNDVVLYHGRLARWIKWRACDVGELFRHFTYVNSFSNPSVASPMSQFIFQPFRRFTYVTAHSPTLPLLHLRHSSFSNPSVVSPTSQLILQSFHCFTYVTVHSPTLPLLHLPHSSFSNPSVASPTSQFILQPFRCFTYVTAHSTTLPLLHLRHSSFSNPSFGSPTSQALHLIHLFCTTKCRRFLLESMQRCVWVSSVFSFENICARIIQTRYNQQAADICLKTEISLTLFIYLPGSVKAIKVYFRI